MWKITFRVIVNFCTVCSELIAKTKNLVLDFCAVKVTWERERSRHLKRTTQCKKA
jgi:hypothetical protein